MKEQIKQTKQKIQLKITCPKCRTSNLVTVNNDWDFINFACYNCDKNISVYRYEEQRRFTFQEFLDILEVKYDDLINKLVSHLNCTIEMECQYSCYNCWNEYLKKKFGVQDE